ncbi:MFS transporter [Clostridium carboxidivorans]|nr:MFS transporter [Clostridium carboxidivorans]
MNNRIKNTFVIIISGMGMLLSTLDTGVINVALPFLEKQFNTTTAITTLSVVGYTMSLAIFILPFGLLSDKFGKLRISYIGLLIFGISSIFCGLANNINSLIIFRIFQGIGAAALQSTSAALITTLVDKDKRSNAISILGVMIGLGPILGPSVGGFFLSLNLWRFIFWINVPLAMIGIMCNQFLISHIDENKQKVRFDIKGSIINSFMVILFLSGLSLLAKQDDLKFSIFLIAAGILMGVILYRVEISSKKAIIDIQTLHDKPKILVYLVQTVVFGFASAMIFLLPPFLFEKVFHINVGMTGILVLGAPLGLVIFSKISGKQNDGLKNRQFSLIGLIIMAISMIGLLLVNNNWTAVLVTLFLFIYGIGGGHFQPANIAIIMSSGGKNSQGSIGALQRMIQNIAIATGTTIGSTIISLLKNDLSLGIKICWSMTLILVAFVILLDIVFNQK